MPPLPGGESYANRQPRVVDAVQPQLGACLLIVSEFHPLERNVAPLQVVAEGIGLRRLPLSVEAYDCIHNSPDLW